MVSLYKIPTDKQCITVLDAGAGSGILSCAFMERLEQFNSIKEIELIGENKNSLKYDYVIGNPPYMKISKNAPEVIAMPEICYGTPNLYFLFAAMGLFNLKDNGEMVYIIPRSWTSGAYSSICKPKQGF